MDKWVIYQQDNDNWRWMRKSEDGDIIDAAEKTFNNRAEAVEDARLKGYTGN